MRLNVHRSEPLEISRAICNDVLGEVVALGRERRIFPFERIAVQLYAADDKQKAIYEAGFIDGRRLQADIIAALKKDNCTLPENLAIEVEIIREPEPEWARQFYHLSYSRAEAAESAPVAATLSIVEGKAQKRRYQISKARTFIGRCEEVKDARQKLMQRNDVVFLDEQAAINRTVSRAHSRIDYDERERSYRLFDTQSRHGTRVERAGKIIEVSRVRGVRLRDGDLIYFGQACARFKLNSRD